ncbi:DNA internalization-related competence protein ComEC/Rec2 [Pelistega sp. NLN82]|uniref:DNA internalization-related competence protein ComEC/Rec2 n=1 Tax=Pelistega ratti TaxID=2652177 RepID=A0A6L9Y4T7_9BURK|nr:DNA internalization-related competence protein ComEC/Rec2 [Pelistega ratti]NEN75411.1 DNA internalization-related competence protein ComEC/Rec2 [Pelistega ratti]
MLLRFCIGVVSGVGLTQYLSVLPPLTVTYYLLISIFVLSIGCLAIYGYKKPYTASLSKKIIGFYQTYQQGIKSILFYLLGFILAFSYCLWLAHQRLDNVLAEEHIGKVSRLLVRVTDIALYDVDSVRFDVEVLDAPFLKGIPDTIRVQWLLSKQFNLYQKKPADHIPLIRPGQVWEMSLKLKVPNTLLNPGGFDNEQFLFRENIRALGTVKGTPTLLKTADHTLSTWIQSWRHDVRANMQPFLEGKRYGAVILALVMGDQQGITQEDWKLFNQTGMTHLVSISGSHITMLSGLAALIALFLLKRIRYKHKRLSEFINIWLIAGGIAVLTALLYCLLAGWGVPAQRTFLMLLMVYLMQLFKYKLSLPSLFLVVAVFVLLLDPWAILTTGFYLSFGAVAVLHQLLARFQLAKIHQQQATSKYSLYMVLLKEWVVLQGAMTVALAPFLMVFFHQISLIAPLVNAYAIFTVGMIITPMALCLGILSVINPWDTLNQWIADSCHYLLEKVMQLSQWLSELSWAMIDFADQPIWVLALCVAGILLGLLPQGIPFKGLAIFLLLPAFYFQDKTIAEGEWQMWAFDIGQGGAILVKTRHHYMLFDTGIRSSVNNNSGERVLLPAFRALGIKQLDALVVSHADLDHSGGMSSLVEQFFIHKVYASFKVDAFIDHEARLLDREISSVNPDLSYQVCAKGVSFSFDGVVFRFLNKPITTLPMKSKNEQSCVLSIEGKYHRVLLTGDIGKAQEKEIQWHPYDIVQVPHHGSHSSSSQIFIEQVSPQIAFAQTGFNNQFKHPHQVVKEAWQKQGSLFLNTAETGALYFRSTVLGLQHEQWREKYRRYWHR